MFEKHYTIRELAKLTGLKYHTLRTKIRKWMETNDGVLNLGTNDYDVLRVPHSVWLRIEESWRRK